MWASITRFELKYQLKSPTFWIAFGIFLAMAFAMVASPSVNILAGSNVDKNAPVVVTMIMTIVSIFFMFVTTAFGANVMIRDQETGFGPLLYSTRLSKANYVLGRTLGAFIVCAVCFLAVPLGFIIGTWMPWLDKETIAPFNISSYAWGYGLIVLPTLLFLVALFSTAATLTKSMMGSYLCCIALIVAYFGFSAFADKSELARHIYAWADPFGSGAIGEVTRYWTPADTNTKFPPFAGVILGNRLLYAALGIGLIVLTQSLLRFDTVGAKPSKAQKLMAKAETAPARTFVSKLANPTFGAGFAMTTLIKRTRFEASQVFSGPVYPIKLLLALALTALMTISANQLYGTAIYPVTRVMVSIVSAGFMTFAMVVAVFYSGQVVWRERERRIHEIIDSTAIPNWAFIIPKAIALMIVLLSTLMVSIVADVAVQTFKGYTDYEFGKYIVWYLLPFTLSFTLMGVLAIFVQALSPNKFTGWAIMVVILLFNMFAGLFGFDHVLYRFNSSPGMPMSDMNGLGQFWIGWVIVKLYWVAFSIGLLVIAHVLWRRGTVSHLSARLKLLPQRLKGPAGVILTTCAVAFVALGGFIFYNTNILNEYVTKGQGERNMVDFEKTFTPVVGLPVPSITAVTLKVDLYPHDLKVVSTGSYVLENKTAASIAKLYIASPKELGYKSLTLDGAKLKTNYDRFGVRLYVFDTPMQPGEKRTLSFTASAAQKGFGNDGLTTRVVDNGTFLTNFEIAPRLGIWSAMEMQDKRLRRKYKLPPLERMKKLEDPAGDQYNYIHADWTTSDITVSTVADQTPVAPGYRVSDVTKDGRRTSRFVSTAPILNFFSMQSAHYQEKHIQHAGVDLTVYYDAQHPRNVDRMLGALSTSLDYYQANFSAYQFKQMRILEFPAYATYAQSFAGTVPYSEGIGFIADVRDPDKIDYTTYVTAHELAHQWWAHQIVGGDKQGATSMSETLAQYSALMVMQKLYGKDQIRRFLKYELDTYLRGRQTDPDGELPLYRVENQQYIHYNKGSLVMYLLSDRMGEDKVNAALRRLLAAHAFKGAPYPRSSELVAALRAEASPADQALITDLFEKITVVELRARDPKVTKRADGKFDVRFTIEAHKYYADAKGKETETPLNDMFDIGAFAAKPGEGKFKAADVLSFGRQPVHTGLQTVTLTLDKKPAFVGVDPYNKWIDRDSDDNVAEAK